MEAVFNSKLPRAATAVTMIVTASMSRRSMIAGLCASYASVISLAVYVSVLADDPAAAAAIAIATAAIGAEFDRCEVLLHLHARSVDVSAVHSVPQMLQEQQHRLPCSIAAVQVTPSAN